MNEQCTKILQKHTKNVIPINLTHNHVQKLDENEAYVTIKDHKEGFPDKISCRLINPSKRDIEKVSKQILDRVSNTI